MEACERGARPRAPGAPAGSAVPRTRTRMAQTAKQPDLELERQETREWLDSLDYVIQHGGSSRTTGLLEALAHHAETPPRVGHLICGRLVPPPRLS